VDEAVSVKTIVLVSVESKDTGDKHSPKKHDKKKQVGYLKMKVIDSLKKELPKVLPWVHTTISNAKRLLLNVHHRIDDDFLQNYFNKFCYKFNRWYMDDLFERLMVAAVSYRWNYLREPYR